MNVNDLVWIKELVVIVFIFIMGFVAGMGRAFSIRDKEDEESRRARSECKIRIFCPHCGKKLPQGYRSLVN